MADDILGQFGPNSAGSEKARATSGGVTECKDLPYSPPVGPKGQSHNTVGLGGDNCGPSGTQGRH